MKRKEILIMKDKPIKQPWPRSVKITVWVLAVSAVYIGAVSDQVGQAIDNAGKGIEQWGTDFGAAAESAGQAIGDAARASVESDTAKAIGRGNRKLQQWMKEASKQGPSDIEDIPMETPALVPTEEDVPIIMPDLDDPMIEYSGTDSH